MLKVFVCIALIAAVSCKSLTNNNNNNKYMIVLRDGSTMTDIDSVMTAIEITEKKVREEMRMDFVNFLFPVVFADLSDETVEKISYLQEVVYIEKDQPVYMYPISDPSYNTSKWLDEGVEEYTDRYNLDIMNKPLGGCLNDKYNPPNDGTGADIYILDTGIKYSHYDYKYMDGREGTRAKYGGYDAVDENGDGSDCHGHGSHCAGIAGGIQSGVARDANLLSIRVLGCSGSGTTSGIVKALNFVGTKHNENKDGEEFVGSVVSMSLGGGKDKTLDRAVNSLTGTGVSVVTASGNEGANACYSSPGSAGDNINVGAHSKPEPDPEESGGGCRNPIAYFSNWGTCVDVIAPGSNVLSVDYSGNTGFIRFSGTSMACPHVAGAVALLMKDNKKLTPPEVKQKLIDRSVDDIDRSTDEEPIREVSKSKRLYVPSTLTS